MLGQSNVITSGMFLQIRSRLMSLTPPIMRGNTDRARSHTRSSDCSSLMLILSCSAVIGHWGAGLHLYIYLIVFPFRVLVLLTGRSVFSQNATHQMDVNSARINQSRWFCGTNVTSITTKLAVLFLGRDDEYELFITGGWVYISPSLGCPVKTVSEIGFPVGF